MAIETVPTCIRLPRPMIQRLKQTARLEAVRRERSVTYSDLIREAVEIHYPEQPEETDRR